MTRPLMSLLPLLALLAAHTPARAAPPVAVTQFSDCTEFVGVAPVPLATARPLVPARYLLVEAGSNAQLVVRVADCHSVKVGPWPARPGRVAQIGLIIQSPDGTATDPNTSINNYTLSYATNSVPLAAQLRAAGVPAELDLDLLIEATPAGSGQAFYAAVSPELAGTPDWFLHGSVKEPGFNTSFLANWWRLNGTRQTRMATTINNIAFDFGSVVSFTTARNSVVGGLVGGNHIAVFPVSFRGAFPAGTLRTTVTP